ncbi:MAG TPA: prepilin-type N-terminal cleavage/methylation domain-containing protein [Firmicutes bacterium]|jgi:prepilin-type N-terminal cleavage/methylation domain-containing protein|nr:prepilin-type N-terminal cleavage/methylation domain-containing protein [Bacillota bacterium]
MRRRGNAGFTLVELLFVLALIGVLSLAAVPQGSRLLTFFSLQRAARELAGTLRELQNRAVVEERAYYIQFIYSLDHGRDGYTAGPFGEKGVFHRLPEGISIANNYLQPKTPLLFYPSGSPNTGASIPLQNKQGDLLTVKVMVATGRVRVVQGLGG